jgi:hypothetical protein
MYKYITHDARPTNKSNLKVVTSSKTNDVIELVSYQTTVAYGYIKSEVYQSYILGHMSDSQILENCNWYFTDEKYSVTTSKQVTRFLNSVCGGRENATEMPHKYFREAIETGLYI